MSEKGGGFMARNSAKRVMSFAKYGNLKKDVATVVDYLWEDEERHYLESEEKEKSNHIFVILKRLRKYCQDATSIK